MARVLKVCVLGDSHIGALKQGWDEIRVNHPDIEIIFFGSPKSSLSNTIIQNGELRPTTDKVRNSFEKTSGGYNRVILKEYDAFVIHGLWLSFHRLLQLHYGLKTNEPCVTQSEHLRIAGADAIVNTYIQNTISKKLQAGIENTTGGKKQVFISPAPFTSEKAIKLGRWKIIFDPDNGSPKREAKALYDAWSKAIVGSCFITQPTETIANSFFTKLAYTSNVTKMLGDGDEFPDEDLAHSNKEYGKLMIAKMINKIKNGTNAKIIENSESRQHPYATLPAHCFWKKTVLNHSPNQIGAWYKKKFEITSSRIATAGSCFAQHIGRRLRKSGFQYLDTEPAPADLPAEKYHDHGYGLYSARYGNIYTTRQLLQLIQRATGEFKPKTTYWEKDGGYVDPFRPTIPAVPYNTVDELLESQKAHMAAVRSLFEQTDLFIFTMGLTEVWVSAEDGSAYPVAPGVTGGQFDPRQHKFTNLEFKAVLEDMRGFIERARQFKKDMRFMLTVSPVPLMATARADTQVVVATTHSKAILRAVAGQLAENRKYVDYFPSYEIINSHVMRSMFYEDDMRNVRDEGVDHVMAQFFAEHQPPSDAIPDTSDDEEEDVFCDEALLAAFGTK